VRTHRCFETPLLCACTSLYQLLKSTRQSGKLLHAWNRYAHCCNPCQLASCSSACGSAALLLH
jgi:hypothetical protein